MASELASEPSRIEEAKQVIAQAAETILQCVVLETEKLGLQHNLQRLGLKGINELQDVEFISAKTTALHLEILQPLQIELVSSQGSQVAPESERKEELAKTTDVQAYAQALVAELLQKSRATIHKYVVAKTQKRLGEIMAAPDENSDVLEEMELLAEEMASPFALRILKIEPQLVELKAQLDSARAKLVRQEHLARMNERGWKCVACSKEVKDLSTIPSDHHLICDCDSYHYLCAKCFADSGRTEDECCEQFFTNHCVRAKDDGLCKGVRELMDAFATTGQFTTAPCGKHYGVAKIGNGSSKVYFMGCYGDTATTSS